MTIGTSARWGRFNGGEHAPHHVVVEAANRQVLVCTGSPADLVRAVPFDAVLEELGCQPCKNFWRRAMRAPNA